MFSNPAMPERRDRPPVPYKKENPDSGTDDPLLHENRKRFRGIRAESLAELARIGGMGHADLGACFSDVHYGPRRLQNDRESKRFEVKVARARPCFHNSLFRHRDAQLRGGLQNCCLIGNAPILVERRERNGHPGELFARFQDRHQRIVGDRQQQADAVSLHRRANRRDESSRIREARWNLNAPFGEPGRASQ